MAAFEKSDRLVLVELRHSKLRLVGIGTGDVFKFITPDGFEAGIVGIDRNIHDNCI
ncbi:MAG: hypothetical protein ACXV74_05675 [Methylobacter sp.]